MIKLLLLIKLWKAINIRFGSETENAFQHDTYYCSYENRTMESGHPNTNIMYCKIAGKLCANDKV